jgi:hypothetical protein
VEADLLEETLDPCAQLDAVHRLDPSDELDHLSLDSTEGWPQVAAPRH